MTDFNIKTIEIRPYKGEHAATVTSKSKYSKFARVNDKFGSGIHVIFGIRKSDSKTEVHSIRFTASKFTVAEAKKWLKDHNWKHIKFEPAIQVKNFSGIISNLINR